VKVAIDTNCLLVSVQEYSVFFWLWQAFRNEKITLCYTTDILNEYYEVLSYYYSVPFAETVLEEILLSPNTMPVTVYYKWNLITVDPDDNKFVDCALHAGADFIITNDKHFNVLKDIPFPKVNIIGIEAFKKIINHYKSLNL
jgi:putative PIN family toxin of toxin-antitoxin system